tara:strand:- start:230 stop:655 length:426 start_codon:yes stop_codon:yes gene_type:complete
MSDTNIGDDTNFDVIEYDDIGMTNYDDNDNISEDESEIDFSNKNDSEVNEIISANQCYDKYYKNSRITKPFLTRFEKAKIIGTRSEMLANGAPALVNVPKHITSTYEIAKMEFNQKVIPLMIKRHLPNSNYEIWRLEDLVY